MKMLLISSVIAAIDQVHAESVHSEDESAIRTAVALYSAAWNRHVHRPMIRLNLLKRRRLPFLGSRLHSWGGPAS